ncbi:hypothetical protein OE88DRAFT_1626505, partial [Heliocybe sulcata]
MVSCYDLYHICSQLCKGKGNNDDPFGGINMILCGDFAQLPPAMNRHPLYSSIVGTKAGPRMSVMAQQTAIGKALWHQFITVVILRENMRQKTQTPEDAKLRTALENMRYKACTEEDIIFLRSRIAGLTPGRPQLADPRFRHVSVITARNMHRDKINILGAKQYATDTSQVLMEFYSLDKWKNPSHSKGKRKLRQSKQLHPSEIIEPEIQKILWNLPHTDTSHVAGKLSLCRGMPVLIKKNIATECCITNGAEAKVVTWHSHSLEGVNILDTLFVELVNPPTPVQLDDLPLNIVPINREHMEIECRLPNDTLEKIIRQQIPVLPNFAMTDYASQGRTRPNNVVDLNNCNSHQSYYTCLSRSASTEGTVVVQGFNPKQITGGASGFLRQ